ncbi:MAG TPA: phosphoglycerate kinase [Thermoanaerobaculia bacterium]|jgi:phosphoglycerate kinase|nr:phosphoglycerate kinase [Thermoanaerobaculia bacterium]
MISIRTIEHLPLPGRGFYRVDYNVPMEDGRITDATRIEETLPTLKLLRDRGCSIVIASHLGRPKGKRSDEYSLAPVRAKLAELLGADVQWADDCVGVDTSALEAGEVLLLENLRFHAEEEANDPQFAAELRKQADCYVNDAFGACHRAHASIEALPRLFGPELSAGGLLLERELTFLQQITNVAQRPFVALLGGAKIAGKIEPLEALVKLADTVLIGGGMANTFLAARGIGMGGSLVDKDSMDVAKRITTVELPVDLVVADDLNNPTNIETVEVASGLKAEQKAFDIGPKTIAEYDRILKAARIIFWNGPMGVFEKEAFAKGTMAMAHALAENADATTVVGGGESVEAVKASGLADRITHISTGGGASLEFIAGEQLPGVEVLKR